MYNLDEIVKKSKQHALKLPLKNAEIAYYPSFFSEKIAHCYFQTLLKKTPWQQDNVKVFGKIYPQPRLTALYGIQGKNYSYSGLTMYPISFTSELTAIKTEIECVIEEKFNTVLLNLYRNGHDSNGWHSDDERELGKNPIIASISLGTQRYFHLKHKKEPALTYKLALTHGSLLLMKGETQHFWFHQIPKTKKVIEQRINLTFRNIID